MFEFLQNIGKGSVEEAHATANDFLVRVDPIVHGIMNRAGGMIHGVLDRLNGTTITVNIPPLPKAEKVE